MELLSRIHRAYWLRTKRGGANDIRNNLRKRGSLDEREAGVCWSEPFACEPT